MRRSETRASEGTSPKPSTFVQVMRALVLGLCMALCGWANGVCAQSEGKGADSSEAMLWSCGILLSELAFSVEGCACDEIRYSFYEDTVFIDLTLGASILGKKMTVSLPKCDSSAILVRSHQNRFYTGSMGPDIIYDKWMFYQSPKDTVRYDAARKCFFINEVLTGEDTSLHMRFRMRFHKFTEFQFYKALRKQLYWDEHRKPLRLSQQQWKAAYKKDGWEMESLILQSAVELHRHILELWQGGRRVKVFVFTYGHMG